MHPKFPTRQRHGAAAAGALAAALLAAAACAPAMAAYPERPIRMIVPFPPGGPNDLLGRIIANGLSQDLGQPVVLDNKGGAGGTIGTDMVAKAPADGYTLLLSGTASLSIAPALYPKLPYDPVKDFAPISLTGTAPSLLIVNNNQPFKTVSELIKAAKAKPGTLNFASAGVGTPPHLAGELFKTMAGVDIVHVPYKGGGPAMTDLIAGQVQLYFCGIASAIPQVKTGKVRPIAVTSSQRTALMPDMPTVAEAGLPGYEVANWYAIVAPAGTPADIVSKVNASLVKLLAKPDVVSQMSELGVDAKSSTPEELAAYQRSELTKWAKVVKQANIPPQE
ncbi:tripartite tricarboxylate transporter substrate binding protein [Pigmentiphaga soli]|uniref:Tripartite tricarboxylate transporter substrate binding protein n=1 Tax=Pigmentiphaga soli TaxID=1007095 RepID=A0ABP8GH43_9BURK